MNKILDNKFSQIVEKYDSFTATVPTTTLNIDVTIGGTIRGFSEALVKEVVRKNPILAQQVNLTVDELDDYASYLLTQRIKIINDDCREFRFVKNLTMPCFLEMALTKIGKVEIRDYALLIVPVDSEPSQMTLAEAQVVSDKLRAIEDQVAVVHGGMPKTQDGDVEVMTLMTCEGQIRGMKRAADPIVQYLGYFFNCKLQDEMFGVLYRIRYEDISTMSELFKAVTQELI